jgi:hypothetical protein
MTEIAAFCAANDVAVINASGVNISTSGTTYLGGTVSIDGFYTLPRATGSNGNVLTSNGAGLATWNTPSAGAITNSEGALGADVTMVSTKTWYTGASLSLASGTWLINAHITLNRTTTTAQHYQVRIQDTTNATSYASSQQYQASVANAPVSMSLTTIITLAGTATIAIQGASSVSTNNLIKAATLANGSGNNATKITAVKIA